MGLLVVELAETTLVQVNPVAWASHLLETMVVPLQALPVAAEGGLRLSEVQPQLPQAVMVELAQPHPSLAPLSHELLGAVDPLMEQVERVGAEQAPIRQRQEAEQRTPVQVGEEPCQELLVLVVQEL